MPKPLMCKPELFEKDLGGRVYIVTGGNSGIGLVTARQLAKQGGTVVLACRRPAEAEKAIEQAVQDGIARERFEARALDLADLDSVRSFAKGFLDSHDKLHGLVNNAGIMNTPMGRTSAGFEMQFGVNHCGHFLLTHLLLDILKASAPSRIVNLSSCFHDVAMGKEGVLEFDDLNFERRDYQGWIAYAQSKLANLVHSRGLADRLGGTGVTAVSVHPGWVRTNLMRHSMPVWIQNTVMRPIMRLMGMIEPWEGAQTTLHCLLDDSIPEHSGEYFSQVGVYRDKSKNKGGWPLVSPNPEVHREGVADQLWETSLKLVI